MYEMIVYNICNDPLFYNFEILYRFNQLFFQ